MVIMGRRPGSICVGTWRVRRGLSVRGLLARRGVVRESVDPEGFI